MVEKIKLLPLLVLLFIASCGNKNTKDDTQIPSGPEIHITINAGDNMQFDQKFIQVRKNQKIVLTLNHTGKMDKSVMGHNWVLLQAGSSTMEFGEKAAAAKETDYIPASEESKIISHTSLIGGGESTTLTFQAPPPGEYPYLCSFPGHYGVMKGKLFVVETQ